MLLRALWSGVAPSGLELPATRGSGDASFRAMFEAARAGQLPSGLAVRVPPGVGASFSEEQLALLARAADRAEAYGIATAAIETPAGYVVLDVKTRSVRGVAPKQPDLVLGGIDGLVRSGEASGAGHAAPKTLPLPGGVAAASNPSLGRALEGAPPTGA